MNAQPAATIAKIEGLRLHVRGIVQGVGFRPATLRLARDHHVTGTVRNEGTAVVIEAFGTTDDLAAFVDAVRALRRGGARVDAMQAERLREFEAPHGFSVVASQSAQPGLGIAPDLATCPDCVAETLDPFSRRYRYPFTACTDCGPRLSVFERTPYDRNNTTLADFPLCIDCAGEYADIDDRRFHAEAVACHACGPKATLRRMDGRAFAPDALSFLDDVDAATSLIGKGETVLVKGLGGYQLACDATNEAAVLKLREAKRREAKPFALLAKNLDMVGEYCVVDVESAAALASPQAPIVLLPRRDDAPPLASGIAPGLSTLGVMLPNTPLHHLLMRRRRAPVVLTSGNLSDEPQAIDAQQIQERLSHCADWVLDHDRRIARRVDDSVGRVVAGEFRVMRRARGYAPAPLLLPRGFEAKTQVLALGGDLKNTFALLRDGQCVLSQHIGDLHDAECHADWKRALADYLDYYDFEPDLVACDLHPQYASTQLAERDYASRRVSIGHHHAHIAACLGEHGWPRDGGKVLGVALDGLGMGEDGELWGGEFLHCDYAGCTRVGTLKPVALIGGDLASREPWRNTYAQIMAEMGWARFAMNFAELELYRFLEAKPRELLLAMIENRTNAPKASSAGRLFDAVAAAIGICRERVAYEGEAAMRMEAMIRDEHLAEDGELDYPFQIPRLGDAQGSRGKGLPYIEPLAMWQALLGDLVLGTPPALIAARFHRGFANAVVTMASKFVDELGYDTVALSGGVFQNKVLAERVVAGLHERGLRALLPRKLPANDGGLAFGQALVALARTH